MRMSVPAVYRRHHIRKQSRVQRSLGGGESHRRFACNKASSHIIDSSAFGKSENRMSDAAMSISERQAKALKELTEIYRDLNERKVTVEAELRQARKTEEALIADAKKRFGLDNPEDLRAELMRRTEANEKMLSDYKASLTEIQSSLESLSRTE